MIDFRIPHLISSISDGRASAAGPASVPGPASSTTSTYQATPYMIFSQEAF